MDFIKPQSLPYPIYRIKLSRVHLCKSVVKLSLFRSLCVLRG